MIRQRNRGFSSGAIGAALVDKCGYTLDARDIGRLVIEDRKAKMGVEKEGRREANLSRTGMRTTSASLVCRPDSQD
ncbi:MAG: hypothetical protein E3J82_05975 [Candidatus Thorarchaeota archaeon]|nr:MAG: hypothetical protein E3J82_05975 [Candidatus Thorarchaeota archaeon]